MDYLLLFRIPPFGPLIAAMITARLSVGVNALAIVLYLSAERGSFAVAGAVAGAFAIGTGAGAPLLGRLVDRRGSRMLLPVGVLHAAGLLTVVLLASTSVTVSVLIGVAFITGVSAPPVQPVLRVLYPRLLREQPELLPAAFALDAVLVDLLFVSGPLVVSVFIALGYPQGALILAAATVLVGTATFVVLIPVGQAMGRSASEAVPTRLLGTLIHPGIRTLVGIILPLGLAFGILEVVLPAYSQEKANPALAGLLLTVWSLGSVVGGLLYGLRRPQRAPADVLLILAVVVPLAMMPLALVSSTPLMLLLLLAAGLPLAPLIAISNELAGFAAPAGSETEAYTWLSTAMVTGIGLGAGVGGMVIDVGSWRHATVAAVGIATIAALIAFRGRSWLPEVSPANTTKKQLVSKQ